MSRITNDCVAENTLSFQIGGVCTPPPFCDSTDRTDEILLALKKCCDRRTITITKIVKQTEIKFVEIQTTKYITLKPGQPTPSSQPLLIIPRGSIKPLPDWTIYNDDWYYKFSNYRWYFKGTGIYVPTTTEIGYNEWKYFNSPSAWESLDRSFGIIQDTPVINSHINKKGYNDKGPKTIKIIGNKTIINGVVTKDRWVDIPVRNKRDPNARSKRIKKLLESL